MCPAPIEFKRVSTNPLKINIIFSEKAYFSINCGWFSITTRFHCQVMQCSVLTLMLCCRRMRGGSPRVRWYQWCWLRTSLLIQRHPTAPSESRSDIANSTWTLLSSSRRLVKSLTECLILNIIDNHTDTQVATIYQLCLLYSHVYTGQKATCSQSLSATLRSQGGHRLSRSS